MTKYKDTDNLGGDGVLRFVCPHCQKTFRYKRGKELNPSVKKIDKWLKACQCPFCGKRISNSKKWKRWNK